MNKRIHATFVRFYPMRLDTRSSMKSVKIAYAGFLMPILYFLSTFTMLLL